MSFKTGNYWPPSKDLKLRKASYTHMKYETSVGQNGDCSVQPVEQTSQPKRGQNRKKRESGDTIT